MSELIQKNDNRATIRWKLLTGASAMALTAYVGSAGLAQAGESGRPPIWIEFGGQMELMQGLGTPFTAPFMTAITPTPAPYGGNIFLEAQKPPRFALGFDGKISFQPDDSDWIFSAAIRYGRSHAKRHMHHQTRIRELYGTTASGYVLHTFAQTSPAADAAMPFEERHTIVDFQVGKDVGLGLFGHGGSSTLSAGVRFAQFRAHQSVGVKAIPSLGTQLIYYQLKYQKFYFLRPSFHEYSLQAQAQRSFRGIGPTLSWNASAVLAGNPQESEITFDWGINAALLFGRQKAKVSHRSGGYHAFYTMHGSQPYRSHVVHSQTPAHSTRSRNITVPNIGGFAGFSLKWPNAKLSIGYRYDDFINAMDTGIDATKKSNLTFHGPFASISIGLGD